MVTTAIHEGNWGRASYLELETTQPPQAIGNLMSQVLARYALAAPPVPSSEPVKLEDWHYDDEEDVHTLAASTAM